MKLYTVTLLLLLFIGCNSGSQTVSVAKPESAIEAARLFLDCTYAGKFTDAQLLLLPSTDATTTIDSLQKAYEKLASSQKVSLKEASINIHGIEEVTPQVTIITYSNTFDKTVHKLKIINKNNEFKIDLPYTFNGNL